MSVQLTCSEFNEGVRQYTRQRNNCGGWKIDTGTTSLQGSRMWMLGRGGVPVPSDNSVLGVQFCIWYSAEYQAPQIGFSQLSGDAASLEEAFPKLHFLNLSPLSDASASTLHSASAPSQRLLVSHGFVDEVGRSLWVVHPCDTVALVECAVADGVTGNAIHVFIMAMRSFVCLPTELVQA